MTQEINIVDLDEFNLNMKSHDQQKSLRKKLKAY